MVAPEENKESGGVDINALQAGTGDAHFDMSKISMAAPVPAPTQVASVASALNNDEGLKKDDIEFGKISIEDLLPDSQKIDLGESGIYTQTVGKQERVHKYNILVSFFLMIIGFFIVSLIGIRLYSAYVDIALNQYSNSSYQPYVEQYQSVQKFLSQYINVSDYYQSSQLYSSLNNGRNDVDAVLNNTRLNYMQKKDILSQGFALLSQRLISNLSSLSVVKQEIAKYGFLPKEIFELLEVDQSTLSIKQLLLSMENIKFTSAIKVFSYLDTFVQSLANVLEDTPENVKKKLQLLDTVGEKDIMVYLNDCYLNPFELDYDCNTIGDFDAYYKLISSDTSLDRVFFKKLMYYLDLKLEQTDLPSFTITFSQFDPKQSKISFTIEINTFKQDELALAQQAIFNPHLFILTNLLNLFKQSLVVIGEDIKTNSIKVMPKVIKIGSTIFTVNSSSMSFTLPLQKPIQREIADVE